MISFKQQQDRFHYRVAAIFIHQDQVLLHRMVGWNAWILPGGRCEWFEPSKQTIVREMEEELGINVELERLCYIVESFFHDKDIHFHELCFYYLIRPTTWNSVLDQQEFIVEEDHTKFLFKWIPIEKLPNEPLFPAFLRTGISNLPLVTEHRIEFEERSR